MEELKRDLEDGPHEWAKYGAAIGLGILTHNVQPGDFVKFSDIYASLSLQRASSEDQWVRFGCTFSSGERSIMKP